MVASVRPPAVAGTFYPDSPELLARAVAGFLDVPATVATARPKALIVPHAGYVYSGAIAGAAFARVAPFAAGIERVVLIGPAHRVFVRGLAWPGAAQLATPLGAIDVDVDALARVPHVAPYAAAHAREHSLEVMLPFLHRIAPHAKVVPLVSSDARPDEVGRALEALWGGPETLIVISSDLSHYHPYATARSLDERTARRILAFEEVDDDQACGAVAINGLSWVARRKHLRAELVDLRSSGDTAGDHAEVVGYGAFAFYETPAS